MFCHAAVPAVAGKENGTEPGDSQPECQQALGSALRLRGGTALNKIIFPEPLRYSEDIDLVRTTEGPIGPILDAMREVLEPWLGQASFAASSVTPKLRFRVPAEEDPEAQIRLKVEINIAETKAFDSPVSIPMHTAAAALQIFRAGRSKYPDGDNWACARVIEDIVGAELHRHMTKTRK